MRARGPRHDGGETLTDSNQGEEVQHNRNFHLSFRDVCSIFRESKGICQCAVPLALHRSGIAAAASLSRANFAIFDFASAIGSDARCPARSACGETKT